MGSGTLSTTKSLTTGSISTTMAPAANARGYRKSEHVKVTWTCG
jgi:hypothetical protein